MPIRLLLISLALLLLNACASPQEAPPPASEPQQLADTPATQLMHLRGVLNTPPQGSDVEIALLLVDERGRPQRLLTDTQIRGNGKSLPFRLSLAAENLPATARVELRARVSQSGRLLQHLPPRPIQHVLDQDLGQLFLSSKP